MNFIHYKENKSFVLVTLTQLVGTMHNICKVLDSNPDHHKKKNQVIYYYSDANWKKYD